MLLKTLHRLPLVLLSCCLLALSACSRQAPVAAEAFVFGTRVELLTWGADEAVADAAMGEVLREYDRLHNAFHAWRPSEVTELNAAIAAGRPHKVSPELAALLDVASDMAAAGDYLFDPGIGLLVKLWGFHGDEFVAALPPTQELQRLRLAHPSIADLHIVDGVVSSDNPLTQLDFGGYLKGVALDRAAVILRSHGVNNALVNIGGNVLALGARGEQPWRVGIRHPRAEEAGGAPLATLELHDGEAIGASGDYQRYFELNARRYCHIIDPRSAEPAFATQSLTVLVAAGKDAGMRSDVWSKPLFIAGDQWPSLARQLGAGSVLRVDAGGRISASASMRERLTFTAGDDIDITVIDLAERQR